MTQLRGEGILGAARLHQDSAGDRAQPRMGVEEIRRTAQRSRLPPGVVVAERHIGGRGLGDGDVAADGAEVGGRPDQPHLRKTVRDGVGGAVGGGVVDHDDRRLLRQRAQMLEGPQQLRATVPGDDHHGDPRVSGHWTPSRMTTLRSRWGGSGRRRSRATGSRRATPANEARASASASASVVSRAVSVKANRKGRRSHGGQHRVPAFGTVPLSRRRADGGRLVHGDDLGEVAAVPSGGRQVVGEQPLLADEEQHRVEATDLEERRSPYCAAARQKSQDLRSVRAAKRRVGHRIVDGVLDSVLADDRAGRDQAEPLIGVERRHRGGERAGLPP